MIIGYSNQRSNYHIIIIGGGPGGTSAAIWAAQLGFRVTLIESSKFPRNRPGETLHPGIESLFKILGVSTKINRKNFIRHSGIYVKWNTSTTKFVPFGSDINGKWLGYQILRSELDIILLEHAKKLGVEVLQPCYASNIIIKNNKIVGIKTSLGEIHSDFVIDAAGSTHWLANRFNLQIEKYSPPLIAYYGYCKGKYSSNELPSISATNTGWFWIAKINNDLYQWTILNFSKTSISKICYPDVFYNLSHIGEIKGADVTWRKVNHLAGVGYFIVGDAALVLDPSSSHGIIRGIMSGIQALHLISGIINNNISLSAAVKEYNYWVSRWFFHDLNRLKGFYSTNHPFPPSWL